MALTLQPQPADLGQVYTALGQEPATATFIASGSVSEPMGYVVPRCQIMVAPSGAVPAAAASRLGVPALAGKFKVTFLRGQIANPGMNTAVFLTGGIFETNFTFDAEGFAEEQEFRNPANHLSPWESPDQNRVYFVMPEDLAPLNKGAEQEHCRDFIRAYELTLQAVDAAFLSLNGTTMDGYLSRPEAQKAMVQRVGEKLAPALRPIACDPVQLEKKFKELLQQSRDGRDGLGWHSFGVRVLDQDPDLREGVSYLTGSPRQESGRVYLEFTQGRTEINLHPSETVIRL